MILILSIPTPYLSFQTLSPQAWLHHRQSPGGRFSLYHMKIMIMVHVTIITVSILIKIIISTIITIIVTRTATLTLGSLRRIATTTPLEPLFTQGMSGSLAWSAPTSASASTFPSASSASQFDCQPLPQALIIIFYLNAVFTRLELLEYPRNDIIYIRDIGQGQFGRVFQVKIQSQMIVVKQLESFR